MVVGAAVDDRKATLRPILPGFLKVSLPDGVAVGDEITLVVKASVVSVYEG